MSKFMERLKQLSEGTPQPMGFQSLGKAHARPKIQMVAAVPPAVAQSAPESLKEADAGILRVADLAAAPELLKTLAGTGIPWGVAAAGTGAVDAGALEKAGADFVVFPALVPVTGLTKRSSGRIMQIESSLGDTLVRTLNALTIEAVLVSDQAPAPLTWHDLMSLGRLAAMISRPVLATVSAGISAEELGALWEGGVDGVVVPIASVKEAAALKDIRKIIAGLDYPTPHRHNRAMAIAPRTRPSPEPEEVEEDDE